VLSNAVNEIVAANLAGEDINVVFAWSHLPSLGCWVARSSRTTTVELVAAAQAKSKISTRQVLLAKLTVILAGRTDQKPSSSGARYRRRDLDIDWARNTRQPTLALCSELFHPSKVGRQECMNSSSRLFNSVRSGGQRAGAICDSRDIVIDNAGTKTRTAVGDVAQIDAGRRHHVSDGRHVSIADLAEDEIGLRDQ